MYLATIPDYENDETGTGTPGNDNPGKSADTVNHMNLFDYGN